MSNFDQKIAPFLGVSVVFLALLYGLACAAHALKIWCIINANIVQTIIIVVPAIASAYLLYWQIRKAQDREEYIEAVLFARKINIVLLNVISLKRDAESTLQSLKDHSPDTVGGKRFFNFCASILESDRLKKPSFITDNDYLIGIEQQAIDKVLDYLEKGGEVLMLMRSLVRIQAATNAERSITLHLDHIDRHELREVIHLFRERTRDPEIKSVEDDGDIQLIFDEINDLLNDAICALKRAEKLLKKQFEEICTVHKIDQVEAVRAMRIISKRFTFNRTIEGIETKN